MAGAGGLPLELFYASGEPLTEGSWELAGGTEAVIETTTAELAGLVELVSVSDCNMIRVSTLESAAVRLQ